MPDNMSGSQDILYAIKFSFMARPTKIRQMESGMAVTAALTDRQGQFVRSIVQLGVNPTVAARQAGFSNPRNSGYYLIRLPHIVAAIRQERARLFDGDLANVAASTLRAVMTDPDAPAAARVSAARTVLEVTRELGRRQNDGDSDRQLHEMTPDELASLISRWETERIKVARDITNEVELLEPPEQPLCAK